MISIVYLLLSGLFAGLLGGLLGIGGSTVMIPAMSEILDRNQHFYQATAMIVNFFVIAPSVWEHRKASAILWPVVKWMAPAAAMSVLLGVWLSNLAFFAGSGSARLAGLFGLFLFYVAWANIRKLINGRRSGDDPAWDPKQLNKAGAVLVGVAMGVVGGLLGVGGGIVCVPLQQKLLNIPLRNAIANSATSILALSVIGATFKNYEVCTNTEYSLHNILHIAIILIPTAIIGGLIGGRLVHKLPLKIIRGAFALLMVVAGFRMVSQFFGM